MVDPQVRQQIEALMMKFQDNFGFRHNATKISHRNDCPETNSWASKLIATDERFKASMSSSTSGTNSSVAEEEKASCSPRMFLGLKNGGTANKIHH
jgi:hypothetical protein